MPLDVRLVPHRNLLVATYLGFAGLQETITASEAISRQPGFHPRMRHLVDLSGLTGYERDFPGFFAMQARLNESFASVPSELVIAFVAPSRIAREMAQMARRGWDGLDLAIIRIFEDEEKALGFLGVPETRIAALQERSDQG